MKLAKVLIQHIMELEENYVENKSTIIKPGEGQDIVDALQWIPGLQEAIDKETA